ncbi:hypothetical protein VTP01DRAFT_9126 [Rhizomucor pusillus]|uniref:uncharacterized protein n=1 Tax=Rhizomucor pusillus TaxID=4840 RepID=UPI003742AF60
MLKNLIILVDCALVARVKARKIAEARKSQRKTKPHSPTALDHLFGSVSSNVTKDIAFFALESKVAYRITRKSLGSSSKRLSPLLCLTPVSKPNRPFPRKKLGSFRSSFFLPHTTMIKN